MYTIEKNITRLHNIHQTYFLDPKELNEAKCKLKKGEYQVYLPYPDSEKNILYTGKEPEVLLYEIQCSSPLRHQDILGTMYSLNIASDLFGDILLIDNHYYIYILPIVQNYFESNFLKVKNSKVELKEINLEELSNYHRSYIELEFIVSSLRIDTILSSIIHTGRSRIENYIKKKEILYNYDYLKDTDIKLKEGDIFSIKKIGKFKFDGIIKSTKQGNMIIRILQYV